MQFYQLLQSALLAGVAIAMPSPAERQEAGVVASTSTPASTALDQKFSHLEEIQTTPDEADTNKPKLPFVKPAAGEERERLLCDEIRTTLDIRNEYDEECLGTSEWCKYMVGQRQSPSLQDCLGTREPDTAAKESNLDQGCKKVAGGVANRNRPGKTDV